MVTIGPLVAEIFEFENVYRRTHGRRIHRYTISSPLSPRLRGAKKIKKNIFFWGGGGRVGGGSGLVGSGGRVGWGQGGYERRIEVFEKIQKIIGGWGVRCVCVWGGGGGVRVDVNLMLGVGVMWGMGDVNQE